MSKKTVMVFPGLRQLWDFAQAAGINAMEINTTERTLACECQEKQIELAKKEFGGKLVQPITT